MSILSDPELVSLLKENGSSIFEDSIEASHTGPFWTHNMLNELDEGYAYADEFATVVAVNSKIIRWRIPRRPWWWRKILHHQSSLTMMLQAGL